MIKKGDSVTKIDFGLKNPWKWQWLEKKIGDTTIGDCIEKVDLPGEARCNVCGKEIAYSSKGCTAIIQHMRGTHHIEAMRTRKENYSLPGKCTFYFLNDRPTVAFVGPYVRPIIINVNDNSLG